MKLHVYISFLLILLSCLGDTSAQEYIVNFKDKGIQFHTPSYYLSSLSNSKKQKRNITPDEKDLPVSSIYKEKIIALNIEILAESKWINSVLIKATDLQIKKLNCLNFIEKVKPIYQSHSFTTEIKQNLPPQAASYWQSKMLQLDELHNNGYNGKGLVIAVFDNGFSNVDINSAFQHLFTSTCH